MTDRELLQQALDVMLAAIKSGDWKVDGACDPDWVIEAIKARLAQHEPEPVAWGVPNTSPTEKAQFMMLLHSPDGCQYPEQLVPLYTSPPQQPEPKPVGCITEVHTKTAYGGTVGIEPQMYGRLPVGTLLYTAPPKKEWVGLTDEEYEEMAEQYVTNCYFDTLEYAKNIEAKLKDKNNG